MPASDRKLLVTTALESTWGKCEHILFAGEWCRLYDRQHNWSNRSYEVVPFHWDDRNKLKKDYDYLEGLHHSLLHSLTASLNSFHKVNCSLRYWQILLDPWLMAYVGVLFDRWETLRTVFESNDNLLTFQASESVSGYVPFSYAEFFYQSQSDEWNCLLFSRIIEKYYLDKCIVDKKNIKLQYKMEGLKSSGRIHRKILKKVSTLVDALFGCLSSNYKVVFLSSGFKLVSLVKLNLAVRQVPRLFLKDFKFFDAEAEVDLDSLDRGGLSLQFGPKNQFETFLKESIIADIPRSLVEGFSSLSNRAGSLKIKTKAIVTGSEHWGNIFAKYWFADQINKGVKLVILEHGGSLPAYKELFNFEEDIADVKGTWFLPYHEKHTKVPPTKLTNRFTSKKFFKRNAARKFCSCIGNEQARWVFRVHYYPMAAQCLISLDWVLILYDALDDGVKKKFKVKPYPNVGWNTKAMYEDAIGIEHIANESRLDDVFKVSKVIICTYPETTFSEAMATNIPVILLYPKQFYERNSVAYTLINILRAARIVFHDPGAAAKHINDIWDDPEVWWSSKDVLFARAEFTRQAISMEGNWLSEWKTFINKIIG